MNRKALQLAISTLILILLGIILLVALIFAIRGGFDDLSETTSPFTDSAEATAIRTTCLESCNNNVKFTYCCQDYTLNEETVNCNDPRLDIQCSLECEPDFCDSPQ